MKKINFILAMVLATGMATAQKTTWLTQSGTSNLATITQNALVSGDATAIYADQSGTSNSLVSLQYGKANYIRLTDEGNSNIASMQQYTTPSGSNSADITQSGWYNNASLTQSAVTPGATDVSTNTAHATQSGSNNAYSLAQGSANGQSSNNSYLIQTGNNNNAYNGYNNGYYISSGISQVGLKNYSEISQNYGSSNYASLSQVNSVTSAVTPTATDISFSWQDFGQSNNLAISQSGISKLQQATSDQNGSYNKTTINQVSVNEQDVWSTQKGTSDNIIVSQSN